MSCDPIYRFDADEIHHRVEMTCQGILAETRRNADEFIWTTISSVDELGEVRIFPLLTLGGKRSEHVDPTTQRCATFDRRNR